MNTVFFDFDGTIYDTVEGIARSARFALNQLGMDAPEEELRCFAGPPLVAMFMEKFGFDREKAEYATAQFRVRYKPIGLYESRPFPGIKEMLERLRRNGLRLAVTTSKPTSLARELLEREGMWGLFDVVCGSGDSGENNAKWCVIQTAMEILEAEPEDCVLVGDTKYDVEGARRCGIPCIGVGYGYAAPGELEAAGAASIAADPEELEKMLLAWGGENS